MMDKKSTGRPRLYDSTAEKVDAFRRRQEASGYLRKEVLVTTETWEQVIELAKQHGVSASDAASGLLENGLKAFVSPPPVELPMFSRKQRSDAPAPVTTQSNPIQDFFERRKESLHKAAKSKDSAE